MTEKLLTVEEWQDKKIDLGDEVFDPIFEEWRDTTHGPFQKIVVYRGRESGRLLHPDFGDILESIEGDH